MPLARLPRRPGVYGPSTTIYNRFHRWARRGIWQGMFEALAVAEPGDVQMIDSTTAKAHRSAAGGKGGRIPGDRSLSRRAHDKIHAVVDGCGRPVAFQITPGQRGDAPMARGLLERLPPACLCAADAAYDSGGLRRFLQQRGTQPVIPNNPTRKHPQPFDPEPYKLRNLIERMFCRLKDWRRIATRYDKLAGNFAAAIAIAATLTWWL